MRETENEKRRNRLSKCPPATPVRTAAMATACGQKVPR